MEQSGQGTRRKNSITLVIGILITMFTCLFFSGAVLLDVEGAKATGKLSNVSTGCPPNKSCWTGKMDFTTAEGEAISFYPMTFPLLFDLDPFLSGRSYAEYGDYQVRYLEQIPQVAKVKLAYFLEYINLLCGFGLGGLLTLIGWLSARGRNGEQVRAPLVIDLSRWRKK